MNIEKQKEKETIEEETDYANINTWKKWQQRLVCQVALNKGEGDYVNFIKESIRKEK